MVVIVLVGSKFACFFMTLFLVSSPHSGVIWFCWVCEKGVSTLPTSKGLTSVNQRTSVYTHRYCLSMDTLPQAEALRIIMGFVYGLGEREVSSSLDCWAGRMWCQAVSSGTAHLMARIKLSRDRQSGMLEGQTELSPTLELLGPPMPESAVPFWLTNYVKSKIILLLFKLAWDRFLTLSFERRLTDIRGLDSIPQIKVSQFGFLWSLVLKILQKWNFVIKLV